MTCGASASSRESERPAIKRVNMSRVSGFIDARSCVSSGLGWLGLGSLIGLFSRLMEGNLAEQDWKADREKANADRDLAADFVGVVDEASFLLG